MRETPGIGDKIVTDKAFLANFAALDVKLKADLSALANEVKAVKHGTKTKAWQVDAIAGATVTSRAVGKAINDARSNCCRAGAQAGKTAEEGIMSDQPNPAKPGTNSWKASGARTRCSSWCWACARRWRSRCRRSTPCRWAWPRCSCWCAPAAWCR
jgi:hypothetical protein